ncbi:MAG: FxLYD domain-containing protein [Acidobacteria bacterium]|nr:FxLYD domain-containing protein [Acidobacteriota bacterium]
MELMLALLAVVALLMTLGMGAVTWRLLLDERRRSDARVAALVAALDGDRGATASPGSLAALPGGGPAPGWLARVAGLVAAAGLVLAVVLVAAIGLREAGGEGAPSVSATAAEPAPIELLALEHEPAGGMLAIRGSVRAADAPVPGPLAVQATAFDADGGAVASRRTDLPALAPGDVWPFAVEVPAAGVARYRVRFLRDEATVPHVDRRASARVGAAAGVPGDDGGAS